MCMSLSTRDQVVDCSMALFFFLETKRFAPKQGSLQFNSIRLINQTVFRVIVKTTLFSKEAYLALNCFCFCFCFF